MQLQPCRRFRFSAQLFEKLQITPRFQEGCKRLGWKHKRMYIYRQTEDGTTDPLVGSYQQNSPNPAPANAAAD